MIKKICFILLLASTPLYARDITISFDNSLTTRVLDAFAAVYNYQEFLDPPFNQVSNPETKAQFAKRMLANHVKDVVRSHEANTAGETARKGAKDRADTEVDVQ